MPINRDKPDRWKEDIRKSVDLYNKWFLNFAPDAFRKTRILTTQHVEVALRETENLTRVNPEILKAHPGILPTLRMSTCPPIAVDRLIGLAGVHEGLVKTMEKKKRIPPGLAEDKLLEHLKKIGEIIERMADPDIFVWLSRKEPPNEAEIHRAATIVADRLCGSVANPIIRNAQEIRQLKGIAEWLKEKGYQQTIAGEGTKVNTMSPGTFGFRMNVAVKQIGGERTINIPVDVAIKRKSALPDDLPLLIEAKSAGDFTNVNKRQKEEATKMAQLKNTYGEKIEFVLFLCGYFNSGYLGYEAAEGIDWVWEHRISDMEQFGL